MSKVSIQGDASGTGTLTIAAPNTNSNYTLTLPEATGTMLTSAGGQTITKSADTVQTLNRTTSDGTIAEFQKNGSAVGSIGNTGARLFIDSASAAGWGFGGGDLYPRLNGSPSDGGVQLGTSSYRFSNLYLSGGAYLGGTGAANYLDDYEEGTWTPSLTSTSGTLTSVVNGTGYYTKIGNLVTILCRPRIVTNGTGSDALKIGNLPFAKSSNVNFTGATREDGSLGFLVGFSTYNSTTLYLQKYDITYPGGSGYAFAISLSYSV